MNLGTALIYLAFLLSIFSAVASFVLAILSRQGRFYPDKVKLISKLLPIFMFATVTAALVLLYSYFINSYMEIEYVWDYSARTHPIEYKMSGVLAGMAGSLLFWIWCMALSWFVEEIIDLRKPKRTYLMALTRMVMMIIIAIFLYFLITRDIFAPTPQVKLDALPDGQGMNPLLQTPLMIIHPPVVFLAYGFIVISFASAMAYLISDDRDWVKLSLPWSRWAWVFLTLGIGIGGLWAYVVLGWGGYWAWDPVETSSFLPWILLTAFLHAQILHRKKKQYQFAAPALAIYSFVLVIFATFTTRAGGIWQSVHAFGEADVSQNPLDRFLEVLNADGVIMGYFLLMIAIILIGTILLIWAVWRRETEPEDLDKPTKGVVEEVVNDNSLMLLTLIVLVLTTLITLFLLILSINGADRLQFDSKVGIFAMIGVAVLAACLAWKYIGKMITFLLLLVSAAIASGLVILLIIDAITLDQFALYIGLITIPFGVLALWASLFKIIKSINRKSLKGTINAMAPHIVHLGVALILIGFVGSNFMVTEEEITLTLNGPTAKVGNYDLRMIDSEYDGNDHIFVTIEILQDGNKVGEARPGAQIIDGQWRNEISVHGTLIEDIYLTYIDAQVSGNSVSSVNLQVKILPMMSALWTGMWLLAAGVVLRLIIGYSRGGKKIEGRVERRARRRAVREEKPKDYFEDLIEKELEEMD